jgi:hypothetical protein
MTACLAIAGCGSGKSSSSTSPVNFKAGFAASHKEVGTLATEIATDIRAAGSRTDDQLAKEFGTLAARADQQARRLANLTAPSKYSKQVKGLITSFRAVKADLSKIATAATRNDAASAQTAARALLTDAAKVKTADASLSKDLGLPRQHS